ncbi:hypothetical protein F4810DRAFT_719088 [Camillea tinctor]|nr:hypothetical protein F4810DRAFT_719088 [Camillea tinctor]
MSSATMKLNPSSPSPYSSTTTSITTTAPTSSISSPIATTRIPYSSSPSYFPSSSLYSSYSPTRPPPPTSPAEALLRWAQLKKYRIEVTYGVYVYTPVEKAFFWAIFGFLFVAISGAGLLWAGRNLAALARALEGGVLARQEGYVAMGSGAGRAPMTTAEIGGRM